jgi:hypothetical protein
MALRSAVYAQNKGAQKTILLDAAKSVGVNTDDIVENATQFRRSGMGDSILRNADYDANIGGFTNGTLQSVQKLSAAGRIFYEEGEMFSRLIVWNIARDLWKKANPGKLIDDTSIKAITDDAFRMHMNLQRENAAWWQRNAVTALPTQFLQVQAKLVEGLLPKVVGGSGKWTAREKAQVAAGQLVLYGTVGVPMVEQATAYMSNFLGMEPGESPMTEELLMDGMMGVLAESLGFKNVVGESGSLLANLDENIIGDIGRAVISLGEEDAKFFEAFSGPSSSTIKRGVDAAMAIPRAVQDIFRVPTVEGAAKATLRTMDTLADLTSSWSNASKADFIQMHRLMYTKRGDPTLKAQDLEDINIPTMLGKAMGFPMDKERAYWDVRNFNRRRRQTKKDVIDSLKKGIIHYATTNDKEGYRAYSQSLLAPFQEIEREEMLQSVLRVYLNPDSNVDREMQRLINDYVMSGGDFAIPLQVTDLIQEKE